MLRNELHAWVISRMDLACSRSDVGVFIKFVVSALSNLQPNVYFRSLMTATILTCSQIKRLAVKLYVLLTMATCSRL